MSKTKRYTYVWPEVLSPHDYFRSRTEADVTDGVDDVEDVLYVSAYSEQERERPDLGHTLVLELARYSRAALGQAMRAEDVVGDLDEPMEVRLRAWLSRAKELYAHRCQLQDEEARLADRGRSRKPAGRWIGRPPGYRG